MSWESTAEYYRIINETVKKRKGDNRSAKVIIYSVDFRQMVRLMNENNWDEIARLLIVYAKRIEDARADFLLMSTNTKHHAADRISEALSVPFLHIADAVGLKIKNRRFSRVGLLGTKFTMEMDFYRGKLKKEHNIDVIIPDSEDREFIHHTIFNELVKGKFEPDTRSKYVRIIESLHNQGAEGVILGCTEIPMLVTSKDTDIPLFDTARIHAEKAVEWALKK